MTFAEKWSAIVLERLENDLLVSKLTNKDYEGEIRGGNAVNIFGTTKPSMSTYSRNADNLSSKPGNTTIKMLVDQERWASIYVDDVDASQVPYNVEQRAVLDVARAAADDLETNVLGYMHTQASKLTAAVLTKDTVGAAILDIKKALTTAKVPLAGRWLVVTPEVEALVLENSKMVPTVDPAVLAEGKIGRIYGFDVYVSNYLGDITNAQVLAGHAVATTFGMAISKMAKKDVEDGMGMKVQALNVYGRLVTRPEALVAILKA